jgi:uncharacterized protein YciI
MLYVFICRDDPSKPGLRAATRPSHLAYLEGLGAAVRLGGALLDDDGTTVIGSMILIEAETLEAARAIASADPYVSAGLFASVEIHAWRQAAGCVQAG